MGAAKRHSILVVDDDEAVRTQLHWALKDLYEVHLAKSVTEARRVMEREEIALVALDVALSESNGSTDGVSLLKEFLHADPKLKVIIITGQQDDQDLARRTVRLGAFDFYRKPFDLDEFSTIVRRALYIRDLELENEELARTVPRGRTFEHIIGSCPQMLEVFELIRRVSSTDATVLIYGESGTGKELVARAIHDQSPRRSHPFVAINCGAVPENLLESEFFGYEKGAFTGAHVQRKGKFEIADKGTIFLDEIGELSPSLQVKILRFLQEREIERIGARTPISVDVRIVAATNQDLEKQIESGRFRSDLYYRLGVVTVSLPPLRDRGEDVALLATHFLERFGREYNKKALSFSSAAMKEIEKYAWPGNIRELENRIKRAIIMARGTVVQPADLNLPSDSGTRRRQLKAALDEVERTLLIDALNRTRGNVSKAALELGVNRSTFYDLLRKHKIGRKSFKS